MAKQLRLDVAQLTDVGRRREHNEDNMAYVIPKDMQVMAAKGSLFIVADGMGGHAAGEVASEIAVDTVSNVYYQDDSEDVAVALVHAIKRANAAIHQRAAENMLRSGMGTTCVATVLRANMAYIANVGDSRAYLVRGGQARQVSQDHSWVAEQVRAGLLTEDQARTHAQRNVITRSLGTQPDVDIDIFTEPLEEGDSLVLCTDGLSGLVTEEELQHIINQFLPQESVYHLVERANENGGPDNITAIVIHVNEVGWEPPGLRHPVHIGGRETDEDTTLVGGKAVGMTSPMPPRAANGYGAPHLSTGPLLPREEITVPQSTFARSRSRLFYPTLALLLLFIVTLAAGGIYYFLLKPAPNIDQSLQQAQQLITRAGGETTTHPEAALQDLASAQRILHTLPTTQLNDAQHRQLTSLQSTLTQRVQVAIATYNRQYGITALPCSSTTTSAINTNSTNTLPKTIVSIADNQKPLFYTLGEDSNLYRVDQVGNQYSVQSHLNIAGQVLGVAADGSRLFALTAQPGQGNTATKYSIAQIPAGQTSAKLSKEIDARQIANGMVPRLITAWDNDVYIVFASNQGTSSATIIDYDGTKLTMKQKPVSVSTAIVSIAAFPNGQLFLLVGDGSVQSLQFGGQGPQSLPAAVVMPHPLPAGVSATQQDYTQATPVPTVAVPASQNGPFPLQASNRGTLSASSNNGTPHLYIADAANHRILDLTMAGNAGGTSTPTAKSVTPAPTNAGGGTSTSNNVTLQLNQQYVSSSLLSAVRNVTVDPVSGATVYALTQSQNSAATLRLVSINTGPNSCA
ncbi:MAG: Stp1/IreP family PP2C-type Ser/Thr phosphatase [Chloroflexota bacterium]|nr:Stp1/IreP family PP2C-type Ser/Thr phosphatase [Chloroflexota bacterium]